MDSRKHRIFSSGDMAKVRSQDEILATLDAKGSLENLPFMPEMLRYCGKVFIVDKRADKTCDTITGNYVSRRMTNAVHLKNVRCEGDAHGECDTTCLIFWKEAWLRRVDDVGISDQDGARDGVDYEETSKDRTLQTFKCTVEDLYKLTRKGDVLNGGEEIFSCQATELLRATSALPWWDLRQYWRDLESGNFGISEFFRIIFLATLNCISLRITGRRIYPFFDKNLMNRNLTKGEILNLQAGEIVQIRSISEILKTLDRDGKNRGLYYDMNGEMLKYCGREAKVLKRVRKVIDERTGRLLIMKNESVILEGVICCGHYSPNRLLCPRAQYPFWREIWLKRAGS